MFHRVTFLLYPNYIKNSNNSYVAQTQKGIYRQSIVRTLNSINFYVVTQYSALF